jgi:2-isopropylmalate synthase
VATKKNIQIFDTTLRDGSQAEGVALSVADKVKVARKLDELGVHYIEGGWPGSNPKDNEFFEQMKAIKLKRAKLVAFGSTRRVDVAASSDKSFQNILASGVSTVCLFGKTWDLHVRQALRISLADNLKIIADSLAFFKQNKKTVFFDAEHFFDGFKANKTYALNCLKAAAKSGADVLVLCDTNGGSLPDEISKIVRVVRSKIKTPVGIHCHNDSELAVANTLAAVMAGAIQVQGTTNGIGERCGNANLVSVIANLDLKMGFETVGGARLKKLYETAHFVDQVLNRVPSKQQPFVGLSAFAHKGGVHVNAVLKNRLTYEHIDPKWVGNDQRILLSDLSGLATIRHKLTKLGFAGMDLDEGKLLQLIKEREQLGYQYEDAEASFSILVSHALKSYRPHFQLVDFKVTDSIHANAIPKAEASLVLRVGDKESRAEAEGVGPVHALDEALRKCLVSFYPVLALVQLTDYKVRVLSTEAGTRSMVRVHIAFSDGQQNWNTVGVSENIIQASYRALVDGIDYKLLSLDTQAGKSKRPANNS